MGCRVLYLVPRAAATESFIRREIEGLIKHAPDIELDVVYLDTVEPRWTALLSPRTLWALLCELAISSPSQWWRVLRFAAKAAALAERRPSDLIHLHFAHVGVHTARLLARLWNRPWTVSVHAWDVFVPPPRHILQRLRGAAGIAVCNRAAQAVLTELGCASELIYHGIELPCDLPPKSQCSDLLRIVAVGRLVEKKGFGNLIAALKIVKSRGTSFELRLIGSGPLEAQLKEAAQPLASEVIFMGQCSEDLVKETMRASDLLICPSVVAADGDRDGIPNVILEAFANNLPVIACDAGSIAEVVIDGQTGRLLPGGDVDVLAEAIVNFSFDPKLVKEAQERVVQQFNLTCITGRMAHFFNERYLFGKNSR